MMGVPTGLEEDWAELLENARWTRRQADRAIVRIERMEMMLGALCWYMLPASGAGSLKAHAEAHDDEHFKPEGEQQETLCAAPRSAQVSQMV
jgi:hypothetical protein